MYSTILKRGDSIGLFATTHTGPTTLEVLEDLRLGGYYLSVGPFSGILHGVFGGHQFVDLVVVQQVLMAADVVEAAKGFYAINKLDVIAARQVAARRI